MARRAGCGVAAKGGVMDGCYAAYTTSVTFGDSFSSRRSLCGFAAKSVNNNLSQSKKSFNVSKNFFRLGVDLLSSVASSCSSNSRCSLVSLVGVSTTTVKR